MSSEFRPSRISLQLKLTLAHAVTLLLSISIGEVIAVAALSLLLRQSPLNVLGWGLHIVLVLIFAAAFGLVAGASINHLLSRRIRHTLEVSQAWTRGNLTLRITDPRGDELGRLAHQLNLLAEHLEEDEQDLEELRERTDRLSDQVRALAVVEERNRLARELHDSVKQNLFSLAMTASGLRGRLDTLSPMPGDLDEMVHEIETTARAAQVEMTRLIEDLRPESLHSQGLAEALNDYALLLGAREHLLIYVDEQGNDALLPPGVAEALYRVAQEALYNVARHARATRVDVNLRCIPENVSLTIEDNGVGFDANAPHDGLGLGSMAERIMEVGGVLTVDSEPSIGTTVVAEVALPHPLGIRPEHIQEGEDRPIPSIENWAWLGQKLTIPVGQTWPWLPADQIHLRHPLVEAAEDETVSARHFSTLLGLRKDYVIQLGQRGPLVRVRCGHSGYEWEAQGASWALRNVRGVSGRMVLARNGQPLAAMQQRGRMLHTWYEIVYDGRGYCLSYIKGRPGGHVLKDEAGDALISAKGSDPDQLKLHRAVPLPLLVIATIHIVDEVVAEEEMEETEAVQ
jgi:NarL family two-component system sensor histidine kinase LiaS